MRYKITLSYDGTDFCGWQSQPNGNSVQDELERAVKSLTGECVRVVGSGRTDAGVHAVGQVAHFDAQKSLDGKTVVKGLNAYLPQSVRLTACALTDENFDARKSAKKKTYMYVMYRGEFNPLLKNRAVAIGAPDVEAMKTAAAEFTGAHDFSAFCAAGGGAKTFTRTVYDAHIEDDGFFVKFFVTANGFLYNMVRIMTGQLIKASRGEVVDIPALIAAKDRTKAKETAPACGLYLLNVEYER